MTYKVLVSDKLSEKGIDILRSTDGVEVAVNVGLSPEEQAAMIGEYHALIVRSATKLKGAVLDAAKNLKIVVRAGIGVDNIDIPGCTKAGILVENTPHGNANSAAEHAVALLFALARHIPQACASTKAGRWEKSKFKGVELLHKTLGVIGTGNIGAMVCKKAQGLGMQVIGYDPFLTDARAQELGIERVDLDTLLARADAITLHVPLTDETRGILGADAFSKVKPGVLIVNASRGGTVDEAALAVALDEGKVSGAALDVYAQEPVAPDHPLLGYDNVIVTPHLGASTEEAQVNVAVDAAHQVVAYLLKGEKKFALNEVD